MNYIKWAVVWLQDYVRWLGVYTRHLAKDADETRLRELCKELLGPRRRWAPPSSDPTTTSQSPPPSPSALTTTSQGSLETSTAPPPSDPHAWEPTVLGLSKRKLLQDHVLPAIGTNRAVQRLLSEFSDMLQASAPPASALGEGKKD